MIIEIMVDIGPVSLLTELVQLLIGQLLDCGYRHLSTDP